jgi:hypothetical protein
LGWLKKGFPPDENADNKKELFMKAPNKEKGIDPTRFCNVPHLLMKRFGKT